MIRHLRKYRKVESIESVVSMLKGMKNTITDKVNEVLPRRWFANISIESFKDTDGNDVVELFCAAVDSRRTRPDEEILYIQVWFDNGTYIVRDMNVDQFCDECDTLEDVKHSVMCLVEDRLDEMEDF